MFAIDSRDFLNNPLSFGFNTTKQIFLFLHVFDFEGPCSVIPDQLLQLLLSAMTSTCCCAPPP
jgi:hypothetical protein